MVLLAPKMAESGHRRGTPAIPTFTLATTQTVVAAEQ
jgi:hypothetical protein